MGPRIMVVVAFPATSVVACAGETPAPLAEASKVIAAPDTGYPSASIASTVSATGRMLPCAADCLSPEMTRSAATPRGIAVAANTTLADEPAIEARIESVRAMLPSAYERLATPEGPLLGLA